MLSAQIASFLRANWLRFAIVGIALACALFFASHFIMNANGNSGGSAQRQIKIIEVDPQDVADVRKWAEGICRGWTVRGLASVLRVEPSMESIIKYLGKNYTGESRQAVVDVCKRELK